MLGLVAVQGVGSRSTVVFTSSETEESYKGKNEDAAYGSDYNSC